MKVLVFGSQPLTVLHVQISCTETRSQSHHFTVILDMNTVLTLILDSYIIKIMDFIKSINLFIISYNAKGAIITLIVLNDQLQ